MLPLNYVKKVSRLMYQTQAPPPHEMYQRTLSENVPEGELEGRVITLCLEYVEDPETGDMRIVPKVD